MTRELNLDTTKDRLTDSLATARDATRSAIVDDIAPAVGAAISAAHEASAPLYAEAASRASDVAKALGRTPKRSRGKRVGLIAALVAGAAGAFALVSRRTKAPAVPVRPTPAPAPPPTETAPSSVDLTEPTAETVAPH